MKWKHNHMVSLGILLIIILTVFFVAPASADYEDGQDCTYCGEYRYDDWLCDKCGGCSSEVPGGECFTENHCPLCYECHESSEDWCSDCNCCIECVEGICSDCGLCEDCGSYGISWYCPDCGIGICCSPSYMCIDCDRCTDCGTFCTQEGSCQQSDGYRCADCIDTCGNCGTCSECAFVCEGCSGGCNVCTDVCFICFSACSDCGDMCPDCGSMCTDCCETEECGCGCMTMCPGCDSTGGELCPDCGERCSECADVCPDCGLCEDCAVDMCTDCYRCADCYDSRCEYCELCDDCTNMCDDCTNMCVDCCETEECDCGCIEICPSCSELTAQICPDCEARCPNCADVCPDCGLCEDCAVDMCVDCHQCADCYDARCDDCYRCDDCVDMCDGCDDMCLDCCETENCECGCTCPNCGSNGVNICPECGERCTDCGDLCSDCGKCSNCYETRCGTCKECSDCTFMCGDCTNMCVYCCDDTDCDCGCNTAACPNCGSTKGMICVDCGKYCSRCLTDTAFCSTCRLCEGCTQVCVECITFTKKDEVCINCADEWCSDCYMCAWHCAGLGCEPGCGCDGHGYCPNCGSKEGTICPDCGEVCTECNYGNCPDCYTCVDCLGLKYPYVCGWCLKCPDCVTLCEECIDMCVECCALGKCDECECNGPACPGCGSRSGTICPDCGEVCTECNYGNCPDCYTCVDCLELKNPYPAIPCCAWCMKCPDCVTLCEECNDMCVECCALGYCDDYDDCDCDYGPACPGCGSTEGTICPDCGEVCTECNYGNCPDCYTCVDCLELKNPYPAIPCCAWCMKCPDCVTLCEECNDMCVECCALGYCDECECSGAAHTHTWGSWQSSAAQHWKDCSCGETYGLAAHTAGEWISDTPATATADGTKHKECTVCGYVMETGVIPATGAGHTHSYDSGWTTSTTQHWHACSCGEKSGLAAHTASEWITDTAATATTDGSRHKECTVCGYVMETAVIPATGTGHTHSYGSVWLTSATQHWKECSCGETSGLAAHTAGSWITVAAATATTDGIRHKECTVCGYVMETAVIPKTGGGSVYTSSGGGSTAGSLRILFETNGGGAIAPVTGLSYGDRVTAPATPAKDGYTFGGWYKDAACTVSWTSSDAVPGDITLYAKWISSADATVITTTTATSDAFMTLTWTPTAAVTATAVESPAETEAPAPVFGVLAGLAAAGVLFRRRE